MSTLAGYARAVRRHQLAPESILDGYARIRATAEGLHARKPSWVLGGFIDYFEDATTIEYQRLLSTEMSYKLQSPSNWAGRVMNEYTGAMHADEKYNDYYNIQALNELKLFLCYRFKATATLDYPGEPPMQIYRVLEGPASEDNLREMLRRSELPTDITMLAFISFSSGWSLEYILNNVTIFDAGFNPKEQYIRYNEGYNLCIDSYMRDRFRELLQGYDWGANNLLFQGYTNNELDDIREIISEQFSVSEEDLMRYGSRRKEFRLVPSRIQAESVAHLEAARETASEFQKLVDKARIKYEKAGYSAENKAASRPSFATAWTEFKPLGNIQDKRRD